MIFLYTMVCVGSGARVLMWHSKADGLISVAGKNDAVDPLVSGDPAENVTTSVIRDAIQHTHAIYAPAAINARVS